MSTFLAANNAGTTLAGSLTPSATTMAVAVGTGALFPSPGPGQYFSMTLIPQTSSTGLPNEILWVTGVTGDTMTILRGQEGTSALTWNVGDLAQNLWTAGQADSLVQPSQAQAQSWNYGLDTGTANAGIVSLTPAPVALSGIIGAPIRVKKVGSANTGAYTLTVNSMGPTSVVLPGGSALIANALPANGIFDVIYDGSVFELQSLPGVFSISGTAGGDLAGTYPSPVIAANAVTNAKAAQMGANTVKMNATGSTANPSDVSDVNLWANSNLAKMAANTVKMNNTGGTANAQDVGRGHLWQNSDIVQMAAGTVKANLSGGAADQADYSLAALLAALGIGLSGNFAGNGFFTLQIGANVVTVQWGTTGSVGGNSFLTVNLPTNYASANWGVVLTATSNNTTPQSHDAVTSITTTSFTMENASNQSATFFFISIGK